MTADELTPDAVALMKSLVNNPHSVEDCALLRQLMASRMVMGSPAKVHITQAGIRMLAAKEAASLRSTAGLTE